MIIMPILIYSKKDGINELPGNYCWQEKCQQLIALQVIIIW